MRLSDLEGERQHDDEPWGGVVRGVGTGARCLWDDLMKGRSRRISCLIGLLGALCDR